MNAALPRDPTYSFTGARPRYSFTGQPQASSPYLEALDRAEGAYTYTAPRSPYRNALEREQLLGRAPAVRLAGLMLMVLAAVAILATNLGRGPADARMSRWSGVLSVVELAAGASVQAAVTGHVAPQAPAAPVPAPAPAPAAPVDTARPAMAVHTADYRVIAPPSVSAALIDQVLDSYHSPAHGSGALFYDLGVKYGIDPAYALAFYIHESAAGTKGVARFTHGIGNIRTTPGYADYEGYRSYDSFAAGIEDWYKLIKELYVEGWNLTTPDAIIQRYAPWGDNNNPVVYANVVKQLVDSWQTK